MSNLIPATIMGAAFDIAKAEFGLLDGFKADRTNAKGVTVTRTELGVAMSGNKAEKAKFVNHVALEMWAKSQVGKIASELLRVFPKLAKEVESTNAAINNVLATSPELGDKLRLINTTKPSKLDVMAMFALAQNLPGADKGEKAKLLAAGRAINSYELRVQEIAQDLHAQAQAALTN